MKLMVMHKHDANTEAGMAPPSELIEAMGALIGGMVQEGKLLDGDGLGPTKSRSRITFSKGAATVVHGPFAPSENELPAGFVKVKVRSRDEAIALATKIGEAIGGELELEVSKLNEAWDLGIAEKPADAPLRYLIITKATPATESGRGADLDAIARELVSEGTLLGSATLTPSSRAKRLEWRGGKRTVLDGPFAESKELVGGYAILEMPSVEDCIAFTDRYAEILLTVADALEIDIRPLP